MENIYFCDYEDFIFYVLDKFELIQNLDEFNDIFIVAKYESAKEIIKGLILAGCDIHSVILEGGESRDYWDEYVISIAIIDDKLEVWCEPMKREGEYISDEATITYILDNCSSACIPYCKGKLVYEVGIGDDDYESCESDECACCTGCTSIDQNEKYVEYSKDDNGNMHGFTASKSDKNSYYAMSFYSTDKLSKQDIQSLLQEHGF